MRLLRSVTCASLLLSSLALGGLAAPPAGADAAAGYQVSAIDPVLKTPLPVATFDADGAGDVADEVTGATDRDSGQVLGYPAGSTTPVSLGRAAAPGVAVANGWVAWASAADASGNPTEVSVSTIRGSSTRSLTLTPPQGFDGVAGDGSLILDVPDATGTELELQPATGAATMLAHASALGEVVADGTEIVAALQQADGSWTVDHIDLGPATPVVTPVRTGQADEPDVFTTASTYGWDDPAALTLSWQQRGSVATPNVIAMPASFDGQGQTDGTQVSWLDGNDGLVLAPISNLADPVVLPLQNSSDAAFSPRGFLFLGGDQVVDNGLQILASDDTYSTLDPVGANVDRTSALALTAGRLVRAGAEVSSTPLTVDAPPSQSGAAVDLLDQSGGSVRASGVYTSVSQGSGFVLFQGSQLVFTSPSNSYVMDLHGTDLVYALDNGNAVHVRDLASGAETVFPGTAGYVTAGGGVIAEHSYVTGGINFYSEVPAAQPQVSVYAPPPPSCANPLLERNSGFFAEVVCADNSILVLDGLTGKTYAATQNEQLGDGVLLDGLYGSTYCVAIQVLTAGETSPTCIGETAYSTPPALDDTGGSVAWVDPDDVTHVVKVLPDPPVVGTPNFPSLVAPGAPWTLDVPVSGATTWTLTLADQNSRQSITTFTGSSTGTIHAVWSGRASQGGITWTLAALTPGGREVSLTGNFSVAITFPTFPSQSGQRSPLPQPKAPHLLYSLGRVKTIRGVTQLKHGTIALVTSAAGSVGCVKVVLQKLVGRKWKTVSTSRCLSATKRTTTREKLGTTGSYRLELVWSLAPTKPLKIIPIRAY